MAAVVALDQLTATPITNPFGLAGAGVAADILRRLAPSLRLGGGTGDFYGIAPGDRRFNRRRYHPAHTVEQSSSVLASRSTRTRSLPNCSRWSNSPSNQSGCRCGCARSQATATTGSSSNCRFDDTITFDPRSLPTSAVAGQHNVWAEPSPKQQIAGSSPARGTKTSIVAGQTD